MCSVIVAEYYGTKKAKNITIWEKILDSALIWIKNFNKYRMKYQTQCFNDTSIDKKILVKKY